MNDRAGAPPRALVAGWFSSDTAEVTAGDLLAARTAAGWLAGAGIEHLLAIGATFRSGAEVAWQAVDPGWVTHLVFVCGPLAGAFPEAVAARFPAATLLAVGVSVVEGTARLGPVRVVPRDGAGEPAADLALGSPAGRSGVLGVVRSHPQPEYGDRQAHDEVHSLLDGLVLRSGMAPLAVDTRLHPGEAHLCSTPDQVLALLARCDAVVTTRLHGLVLSLAAGVPVVAVDPVRGGAKVTAQAAALGWPAALTPEGCTPTALDAALAWCRTAEAGAAARRAGAGAGPSLEASRARLLAELRTAVPATPAP